MPSPIGPPAPDPRKEKITVGQLLNHTSGICPEATGAPNDAHPLADLVKADVADASTRDGRSEADDEE